jgi:hypothetical protein
LSIVDGVTPRHADDFRRLIFYRSFIMRSFLSTVSFIAAALTCALSPISASASEGAQSAGHGLKCYTAAVVQPNGTVRYERICYKGI